MRFRLIGTALVCLSILAYEILATRLVGIGLEGHFAMLPIAFAMLGMGAATSFMSLGVWSESSEPRTSALSWLAMSLGLSYLLGLAALTGLGNCYDNAVVETFFKTIKSELIWPVAWQTRSQAENAVARYIDGFYNPIRRHSTLGYQSPVQFEMAGRE